MSWNRNYLETHTPIPVKKSKLQHLKETVIKQGGLPRSETKMIVRDRDRRQHEHGCSKARLGFYMTKLGHAQHDEPRIELQHWCTRREDPAILNAGLHDFSSSRKLLAGLVAEGSVAPALGHTVRKHIDLVEVLVSSIGRTDFAGPWLAASEDGSVGLDWRHGKRRVAITFDREGTVEHYATDGATESGGAIDDPIDALKLVAWVLANPGR